MNVVYMQMSSLAYSNMERVSSHVRLWFWEAGYESLTAAVWGREMSELRFASATQRQENPLSIVNVPKHKE